MCKTIRKPYGVGNSGAAFNDSFAVSSQTEGLSSLSCHKAHKGTKSNFLPSSTPLTPLNPPEFGSKNLADLSKDQQLAVESHKAACLERWRLIESRKGIDEANRKAQALGVWRREKERLDDEVRLLNNGGLELSLEAELLEKESVRAWDDWARKNRSESGLSYLDFDEDLKADHLGKLSYMPADAKVLNAVDLMIGTQDILIKHHLVGASIPNHAGGGKRGKITALSSSSVKRMKLHIRNVESSEIKAFLTLTYPADFPADGQLIKRHLKNMKQWLLRQGVSGVWFMEFQQRGAPHFHMFLNGWPAKGLNGCAMAWHRIVGTKDDKHLAWHLGKLSGRPCLEWMRKAHAASAYATKYASKMVQKSVPDWFKNVGRFWGQFGGLRPNWKFESSHGEDFVESVHDLVIGFRSKFDGSLEKWIDRAFISCTLWGGVQDVEYDDFCNAHGFFSV